MCVYLCVSAMNFPGTLLSEDAKKTLAVVVNAFFVMGFYCTPVSQIEAETEWTQTRLLLHAQLLYIFVSSHWLDRKLRGAFVMQRMDHSCPFP